MAKFRLLGDQVRRSFSAATTQIAAGRLFMELCGYCSGTAKVAQDVWDGSTNRTVYVPCGACGFTGIDHAATERKKREAEQQRDAAERQRRAGVDKQKHRAKANSNQSGSIPGIAWVQSFGIGLAVYYFATTSFKMSDGSAAWAALFAAAAALVFWQVLLRVLLVAVIGWLLWQWSNGSKVSSLRFDGVPAAHAGPSRPEAAGDTEASSATPSFAD